MTTATRWLSAITPAPDIPAHGEPPSRANGDAGVRAVLDDARVGAAVASLQSYGQKACGIPAP